ncbi:MAG: helix-turn-helix transcriptional regulator [Gemmatimonadaceae bacterium]|nr:helix-turn-helix transcriptional regulator [Gemmatimonadaceae bacterium]NUQ94091.1 helix-turn-helix transcriptional regulator [Gemmatimonadaceae bacterium]NUR21120.1 helix-turn-helix transcriptional regulator [Gemmatimonadaceae bacterium]NUS98390.1 helix-turn-helix transcriptional regulator [Gemmatimonadaceae bacterium]
MSTVSALSQFVSWDGGCLFVSRGGGLVPVHAHYAIQLAFGSEHGLAFRPSENAEWTSYDGALIASRQPHSMDAAGPRACVVIFVEPETREGRALAELHGDEGIVALSAGQLGEAGPALFAAWREQHGLQAVADAAQRLIRSLTGTVAPSNVADERILRATSYIRSHIDEPLTLEKVAEVACLSPSRFRHLFVEETGMALRPYILWRRFLRVWELLMQGESLSSAAHAAGFADAAHLTRTSRTMFGFAPSMMRIEPGARAQAEGTAASSVMANGALPGRSAPTYK